MNKFSCKGCTKRHLYCHSICKEYKEEKERATKLNREMAEARKSILLHSNGIYWDGKVNYRKYKGKVLRGGK